MSYFDKMKDNLRRQANRERAQVAEYKAEVTPKAKRAYKSKQTRK